MNLRLAITSLILLSLSWLSPPASGQDHGHVHSSRKGAKKLPLPKERGVWHFAVYGDRTGGPRSGLKVLRQAVSDTNLLDPDLVMTVGDLIQGYNTTGPWMSQMKEFQGIMKGLKMPWYPVAGNHDVYWRGPGRPARQHEQNYEKHFGPLWYWFPHKDAAFIVLYTDEGDPRDGSKGFSQKRHIQMSQTQINWLAESLKKTGKYRHCFVFLHHPRWIKQMYRPNNWDVVHKLLVKAGNVRGVFAGHIHQMIYSGKRDGIEYFALATTGGGLARTFPRAGYLHHFNIVTVRNSGIQIATLPVGTVIDPRSIDMTRYKDLISLLKAPLIEGPKPLQLPSLGGPRRGTLTLGFKNPSHFDVDVTFKLDGNPRWQFSPDHIHLIVRAGETRQFSARYQYSLDGPGNNPFPKVTGRIDALTKEARIELPERTWSLPNKLGDIPARFFKTSPNRHLVLDGKRACVKVPNRQLALPKGPMTLEGWCYPLKHRKGTHPFLAKTENSGYGIFSKDGSPRGYVHVGGQYVEVTAPQTLTLRRWHHLALVHDGEQARLYLDGQKVGAKPAKGPIRANNKPFYVGADPNYEGEPNDFLKAHIDEVRISKVARYHGAFKPTRSHKSDDNTVLLLRFNRDLGPFILDHSPRRDHARVMGAARCLGDAH